MVVTKIFKSGERYVFLLDKNGVPDFWVTHFVTQQLRMNHTANSIDTYLKSIKHFKLWEQLNERNLLDEIYRGQVPSLDDIKSIKDHCVYQAKVFKEKLNISSVISDMGKFYLSKTQENPTVSKTQYITRIAHIAEYLHFIGLERVKCKPSAAELIDLLDAMKKQLKRGKAKGKNQKKVDKSGVADDVFDDFVLITQPSSQYNPFKDDSIRLRNYLIVQTLYETGIRCSELLALQIADIGSCVNEATITIERRHNNKDDPRIKEPTAKTSGRVIEISKGLREALNSYIKSIRSKTATSKYHPFIFVSHKNKTGSYKSGKPLGQRSVNALFDKIKEVNPERFWAITPHSYRHYFNDRLSDSMDKMKQQVSEEVGRLESAGMQQAAKHYAHENMITEKRELEIRAELNGHTSLDSGQIYLERTLKKQANAVRQKMHKDLKHKLESRHGNY